MGEDEMDQVKMMFSILSLLVAATFAALYIYIFSLHTEMNGMKVEGTDEVVSAASFPAEYKRVDEFIADFHAFYNRTTGYGMIDRELDMEVQQAHADAAITYIEVFLKNGVAHDDLKRDLESIKDLSSHELTRGEVRSLHRYYHDLDKSLNHYDHEDTFGVTETFGDQ
ncbi:hypothetical protein [Pseudalkalibacillus hwajinpoensis]|uniref:Uncharacterized protein n=1 Tax=Guptibacillus hwajinpoensis TaxID=208199 RepID=A0A4U1ML58_9BACL|nr:hypothetical protein [Pseudalkalibacillus hwajinpoensis]TKD71262.1 hypothetical protein FBF83_00165 [Pseudalkalibacillus hwajinpoensis]